MSHWLDGLYTLGILLSGAGTWRASRRSKKAAQQSSDAEEIHRAWARLANSLRAENAALRRECRRLRDALAQALAERFDKTH